MLGRMRYVRAGAVAAVAIATAGCAQGADEYQADSAQAQCEEWISEELVSPGTAQYAITSSTGGDTGPWTFAGTVDAENAYGGTLRGEWECEIRLDGGQWLGRSRLL